MTKDEFTAAYVLGQRITEQGVRTTIAQDRRKGRLVMIHELTSATPEEMRSIASLIQQLGPEDAAQIIADVDVEGEARLITKFLKGFTSLREWLELAVSKADSYVEPSAAPAQSSPQQVVVPAPEAALGPSFTELFLNPITPAPPSSVGTPAESASDLPQDDTDRFLSTFGITTAATPPAATIPPVTPLAAPAAPPLEQVPTLAPAGPLSGAPPPLTPVPNSSPREELTPLPLGKAPAAAPSAAPSSLDATPQTSAPPSQRRDVTAAEESSGGFTDLFNQSVYRPNPSPAPPSPFPVRAAPPRVEAAAPDAPVLNLEALAPDVGLHTPARDAGPFAGSGEPPRPPNEGGLRQHAPAHRAQSPDAIASNYSAALTPARAHPASPALPPPSTAKPPPAPKSSFLPVILTVVATIILAVATIVIFALTAR